MAGFVHGAKTSNVLVLGVEFSDLWAGCFCIFAFLFLLSFRDCLLCTYFFLLFAVEFSLLLCFCSCLCWCIFAVVVYNNNIFLVHICCCVCLPWLPTIT